MATCLTRHYKLQLINGPPTSNILKAFIQSGVKNPPTQPHSIRWIAWCNSSVTKRNIVPDCLAVTTRRKAPHIFQRFIFHKYRLAGASSPSSATRSNGHCSQSCRLAESAPLPGAKCSNYLLLCSSRLSVPTSPTSATPVTRTVLVLGTPKIVGTSIMQFHTSRTSILLSMTHYNSNNPYYLWCLPFYAC